MTNNPFENALLQLKRAETVQSFDPALIADLWSPSGGGAYFYPPRYGRRLNAPF